MSAAQGSDGTGRKVTSAPVNGSRVPSGPPRRRTGVVVAATTGVVALTLAGAGFAVATAHSSSTSVATPASSGDVTARVVDVPAPLAAVPGVDTTTSSTGGDHDRRTSALLALAAAPSLATAESAVVDPLLRFYGVTTSPDAANVFDVAASPVLAAGDVLGVALSAQEYTGGAHVRETRASLYTDVSSDTTWRGTDLVGDATALAQDVRTALHGAGLGGGAVLPDDVTADVRFDRSGALVVVLPSGLVTAPAAGDVAVRVTPDETTTVLSDVGRTVRSAAVAHHPFTPRAAGTTSSPTTPSTPSTPHATTRTPQRTAPQSEPTTQRPRHPQHTAAPQRTSTPSDVDCTRLHCIALTFDDGPGPYTAKLLRELADAQVKATFFLIGQQVHGYADQVRAEQAAGHAIGNHSWSHPQLTLLGRSSLDAELDRTSAAIRSVTGEDPVLMRPPYGAVNHTVLGELKSRGMTGVLWDVDTEDWKNRDVDITTQRALAGAHSGAIILMHDIHPTTVEAVPGIIRRLQAKGYTLVTVPQLLGGHLTPGAKVFNQG